MSARKKFNKKTLCMYIESEEMTQAVEELNLSFNQKLTLILHLARGKDYIELLKQLRADYYNVEDYKKLSTLLIRNYKKRNTQFSCKILDMMERMSNEKEHCGNAIFQPFAYYKVGDLVEISDGPTYAKFIIMSNTRKGEHPYTEQKYTCYRLDVPNVKKNIELKLFVETIPVDRINKVALEKLSQNEYKKYNTYRRELKLPPLAMIMDCNKTPCEQCVVGKQKLSSFLNKYDDVDDATSHFNKWKEECMSSHTLQVD